MKKIVYPLILLLLFACDGSVSSSDNLKNLELSNDLKTLLISNPTNNREDLPFEASASITPSNQKEGYFVASCYFAYKNTSLTGVHFIALPYSSDLTKNVTNVANVGYDNQVYSLDSKVDVTSLTFKAYRISFLMNNDAEDIKVFFKSNTISGITFSFSNQEISR